MLKTRKRTGLSLAVLLFFSLCLPIIGLADEVILRDGTRIEGDVVTVNKNTVRIRTSLGTLEIARKRVKKITFYQMLTNIKLSDMLPSHLIGHKLTISLINGTKVSGDEEVYGINIDAELTGFWSTDKEYIFAGVVDCASEKGALKLARSLNMTERQIEKGAGSRLKWKEGVMEITGVWISFADAYVDSKMYVGIAQWSRGDKAFIVIMTGPIGNYSNSTLRRAVVEIESHLRSIPP